MKRVTRRHIKSWLAPIRRCFAELKSGEVDSLDGYAATRTDEADSYAQIDYCIEGFLALLDRLCPKVAVGTIIQIKDKLSNQEILTTSEIDDALSVLKRCEDALIKIPNREIKDASVTEQILIAMDEIREAA